MLLSWLPGIREVRTPIVVGYVFLVGVWMLAFDRLPQTTGEARTRFPELQRMTEIAGPIGTTAAVSFVAYLLGGAIAEASNRALHITGPSIEVDSSRFRQFMRRKVSVTHDASVNDLERRLTELVEREERAVPAKNRDEARAIASRGLGLNRQWWRWGTTGSRDERQLEPAVRVLSEIKAGYVDDRILARNEALYSELSRSRSEAEFRGGLIPSIIVVAVGAVNVLHLDLWTIVAVGLATLSLIAWLVTDALRMRTRSREIAIRAVVDGLVSSPTLDALRSFHTPAPDAQIEPKIGPVDPSSSRGASAGMTSTGRKSTFADRGAGP